jgi:TRAP-type mannitol/chloroaromatic compound transport system permease large subunit
MSRSKMPGPVRAGLILLVLGAITVGIGTYTHKGSLSLYGFILAAGGFLLYFLSFILTRRYSNTRK